MKKILCIIPIVLSLVLSSCAPKYAALTTESYLQDSVGGRVAPAEAPKALAPSGTTNESAVYSAVPQAERIVIKTASLTIVVEDPTLTVNAISAMAEGMGGFVVSSNVYQADQVGDKKIYYGNVTIRIPAAKLNTALDQIKSQVKDSKTDVIDENISGEDVTSTVVDLESRLKNYQATQRQLLIFMDKAIKTQDALDVLRELTSVQEQIEVLQGQIKYYRESALLSAITVSVQPKIPVQPVTVEGWKPLQILRDATQTLVDILRGLFTFLIYVVIILGPFVLLFFFIYWLVWLSRKKKGWVRKGLKFFPPGTQFNPPTLPEKARAKKMKK
jgi:hypothetical protein